MSKVDVLNPLAWSGPTQGPSWGCSKVNFDRCFRKRGRFSPNVDKNGAMAPRTGLGYPHEGPFVDNLTTESAAQLQFASHMKQLCCTSACFSVRGFELRVEGCGLRVEGLGFRVRGEGVGVGF